MIYPSSSDEDSGQEFESKSSAQSPNTSIAVRF